MSTLSVIVLELQNFDIYTNLFITRRDQING